MTRVPIRRALISVYDKTGLGDLARSLDKAGVEIVSTGSTAAAITEAGVPVTRVEDVTGFPECLDGRVKTLHPAVHAGLLADLSRPSHQAQLAELGIAPFQLLVSNLYPFEAAVSSGAPAAECVEQIDIGGPAMVRAAAKNHEHVAVITDPSGYAEVAGALADGGFSREQRRRLAARAFAHTAAYDSAVASWFAGEYAPDETAAETGWPDFAGAVWSRREVLRYGENPHQRAALYVPPGPAGIASAAQLHGKAMSYNNYVDAAAAWRAAFDFVQPCVAIIKHSNPCGIALGADLAEAHRKANASDPESAFGGVIAANGVVTAEMAAQVAEVFTEIVIAPEFAPEALEVLKASKNLRLLACPPPAGRGQASATGSGSAMISQAEWRQVDGGLLLQTPDRIDAPGDDPASWALKTGQPGLPGHAGRPGLRLAGHPQREVQRDPAGRRAGLGRGRHGTGQPGGRGPARGVQGGRAGGRDGRGQRCVLPVPGRPGGTDPGRDPGRGAAGRVGPRSAVHRGRRAGWDHHVLHWRAALLSLSGAGS